MQLQQTNSSKPNKGFVFVVTVQGNISVSICHSKDLNIQVHSEERTSVHEKKALGFLVKVHEVTHPIKEIIVHNLQYNLSLFSSKCLMQTGQTLHRHVQYNRSLLAKALRAPKPCKNKNKIKTAS